MNNLLRDRRRPLVKYMAGLPQKGTLVELQRWLLDEYHQMPSDGEHSALIRRHQKLLRAIGDAIACQLFSPHLIRTLGRHPGKPATPPSGGEDQAFLISVLEYLAKCAKAPLLTDLTNVLLVGDIVALGTDGVEVVECKRTPIPASPPRVGRLARQRSRGERAARYMRESVVMEENGIVRMAVDVQLPNANTYLLESACEEALSSARGVGVAELGSRDLIIAVTDRAINNGSTNSILREIDGRMRKPLMSAHMEAMLNPSPTNTSIRTYLA